MAVKYISKINNGTEDLSIKDASAVKKSVLITWSALKTLRDGGNLVAGQSYRITDYVTTTVQSETQSAGHQFDVIVCADSPNTLNENAYAALHSGDTYFANSKLEAWELKYCIDNDTNRFAWADTTNGKGVIYWMKDEFDNECSYDFKNIQYASNTGSGFVYSLGGAQDIVYSRDSSFDHIYAGIQYYGFKKASGSAPDPLCTRTLDLSTSMTVYYNHSPFDYGYIKSIQAGVALFTFSQQGNDASLYGISNKVYNNCIRPYYVNNKLTLNKIWFETSSGILTCYSNIFGNNCHSNIFGNNCHSNIFGNSCYNNTFDENCYNNTFDENCYNNTFDENCYNNTFGCYCYYNTLIGSPCIYNIFGNYCFGNTINGDNNIFGNYCFGNTINGDNNIFGNNCNSNTFSNNCNSNTFGSSCYKITFDKNCSCNIIIENGNSNITLTSNQSTSFSAKLQNITIAQGVNNTSTQKTISHNTVNDTFKTTYQSANSQVVNV